LSDFILAAQEELRSLRVYHIALTPVGNTDSWRCSISGYSEPKGSGASCWSMTRDGFTPERAFQNTLNESHVAKLRADQLKTSPIALEKKDQVKAAVAGKSGAELLKLLGLQSNRG
jgi:hypothetical protein